MFKILITLFLILGLGPLHAQADGPVLVELFAAKSCFASPRAYNNLSRVKESRDDVLILTWPVDYWDYLGEEPLALEESKVRQLAYADRFGLRGPYTPQTVFNGKTQCAGSKSTRVEKKLDAVSGADATGVTLNYSGDSITISGPGTAAGDVFIVHYLEGDANPSRMVNPVSSVKKVLHWAGEDVRIDASICNGSCVILVQERDYGEVLATLPLRR